MNVLDNEKLNCKLDDFAERVQPKILQFKEFFLGKILSVVIVCSDDDFSLSHFHNTEVPNKERIAYFDLSKVTDGDYKLIIKSLSWGTKEGVLFDNIDRIPNISEKEDFEYLVQMALKRDTLPTEKGMPIDMLDFSGLMVGAKCSEYPDYLKGKSLQTFIISVKD